MSDRSLGRLERVTLDSVWNNEPEGFTPWLAEPENLRILGDALGFRLRLEAQERTVGQFRADIVCREVGTDARVLIENQLGRTNHIHLGQSITYAAGLGAGVVVWLARGFTEEHRAALDWLNRIAGGEVQFFGFEIELWKIDDSRSAPKFNLVSRPTGRPRPTAPTGPAMGDGAAVVRSFRQKEYWTRFLERLDAAGGPVAGARQALWKPQMVYRVGRSGFGIAATTTHTKRHVRVQLFISGVNAKKHFDLLEREKEEIERELGYPLEWDRLPDSRDCRISRYLHDADPEDQADWPRQHDWLARHVNDMHRVFSRRVKAL